MDITGERIRLTLDSNPTLTLLKAFSRDWLLPLFAEHLEQVEGSVSAEWFHERVSEAHEQIPERQRNVTPADHCRDWVEKRWLAIRAVEELKLLTQDPDADYLFSVSPAIVPMIGADEMMRFEQYFRQSAEAADDTVGSSGNETEEDPA